MKLGSNINDIQKKNRSIVLQTLMEHPEISRVELARITELNKATITNIIHEFFSAGIVKEIGPIEASNGRKVAGLSLCMEDTVTVVIYIHNTYMMTAVCNVHGKIRNDTWIAYRDDHDMESVLNQYKEEIQKQLNYCGAEKFKVLGISVATLGWLFHENGGYYIKAGMMADGFEELDIKHAFSEMFPEMEIWVDHDANMSALAEWYELGKEGKRMPESLLSIVGGIGFGGGIIIRGEVFSGSRGIAGEVGHMGINCMTQRSRKNSRIGGIWEDYASPAAVREAVWEAHQDYPDTVLAENCGLPEIYDAYDRGDELAERVLNHSVKYLAYGLTSLIFILNPEVIVLGDEMIRSGKFEKRLYQYMRDFLPDELYGTLNIQFSRFGKKGILIGAGLAMVKHYLRTYKMIDFIADTLKDEKRDADPQAAGAKPPQPTALGKILPVRRSDLRF